VIRPPELYGNLASSWKSCQQSHPVTNQEELGEGNDEFRLRSIFVPECPKKYGQSGYRDKHQPKEDEDDKKSCGSEQCDAFQ
jgi:hypothetical protein